MSLKRTRSSNNHTALDLTGSSDIIFTLLLFYILTQNFLPALDIALPKLSETSTVQQSEQQVILIGSDSRVSFQNNTLSLAKLKTSAGHFFAELNKSKPVVIRVDRKAPAQAVISIMEIMTRLKCTNLLFQGLPDEHKQDS
jgi:biopolymer transport protein ExbD